MASASEVSAPEIPRALKVTSGEYGASVVWAPDGPVGASTIHSADDPGPV